MNRSVFSLSRLPVLGKYYFVRQASTLLKFARSTSDPRLAAALVEKAAALKSKADPLPDADTASAAPDVERDNRPSDA